MRLSVPEGADLEVDVGDAVAEGGRRGGVALAHLLRQLHVPQLHRVPRVVLRQPLQHSIGLVSKLSPELTFFTPAPMRLA